VVRTLTLVIVVAFCCCSLGLTADDTRLAQIRIERNPGPVLKPGAVLKPAPTATPTAIVQAALFLKRGPDLTVSVTGPRMAAAGDAGSPSR